MWSTNLAVLTAVVGAASTAANPVTSANCKAAIFQKYIDANGTIANVQWASYIPANGSFNPMNYTSSSEYPTNLPEGCGVQINVSSEGSSSYLVGLILPYDWNGRLLSAAAGGGINWVDMGTGTHYGFATLSSNLGHVGIDTEGTWAIGRPEAVIDWGYRAWHGATVLGKLLIEKWYGSSAQYSYFYGCSTGGRQSMKNMQEYPDDYDGILAGAPAWWTTHQQLYNLKQTTYQAPANSSHTIPEAMFDVIAAEVLKQCDPQDGLVDNIISDPAGCNFNPNVLMCNATSAADECLTAEQLATLYKIHNDWVDVNQTYVYGHMWLGSESSWLDGNIGLGEDSTIDQQYWYPRDLMGLSDFVWQDLDFSTVQLADQLNPGNATADKFDISAFYNRGGKFLHYHGLSDAYVSPDASIYYYDQASSALKPQGVEMDDFYRMFLIPGMEHCYSTPGIMNAPWYIAGADQAAMINTGTYSVPGYRDAKHDIILAMMAWVENGTAPDSIIATKWKNDTTATEVLRQRPVCHYPYQAQYNGTGDPDEPTNWSCKLLY
ncbi:tannase and feruloyl esterase [Aspergillus saccharolyticus JOP 1030-1]|uniref:Carboxylic ester hydrolase n=1 Tax=Aspergillus saccharolyticus JOP 1030-1 TaxID=1450539 RepID=A0A318Z4J2_9EURO|nr:tannase and feruloyl esterase [Aspergillus saccharolyticus JOP 1030-1]PYH42241.1 tannase and feruloyl esterase [Aspergillus saccharolyticus JOP 1030-1]